MHMFDDTLKHSCSSYKEKLLSFRTFPQNPKLCPVPALIQYLDIRLLRSSVLFITTVTPFKRASSDASDRCIKHTMHEAGIYTSLFSPHSCRSAVTSKVIEKILESSKGSTNFTFKKNSF